MFSRTESYRGKLQHSKNILAWSCFTSRQVFWELYRVPRQAALISQRGWLSTSVAAGTWC